jgi:hypothetical protein
VGEEFEVTGVGWKESAADVVLSSAGLSFLDYFLRVCEGCSRFLHSQILKWAVASAAQDKHNTTANK